jgi:membrane protein YdbS with pleckstrin-like domain
MYERAKAALLWFLKVPHEPLDPMGAVQSLRVFRAARGYLHYLTAAWLVTQAGVLLGALIATVSIVATSRAAGPIPSVIGAIELLALSFLLVQAGVTYFSMRLDYEMRWYKVTDRSLRIRSGVWNVHEMTMTFANVQNITITQGPLERLFGISNVKVETAGGGGRAGAHRHGDGHGVNLHVGVFKGVDNPDEIRALILERLQRLRDTGLGDADDLQEVDGLDVLSALRDEARALRRAAEAAVPVRH